MIFIIAFTLIHICAQQPQNIKHTVVATEKGQFHGWPANNGVWVWGNEILVGFTQVEYEETESHNIKENAEQKSLLAKSTDGGNTWTYFNPDNFVGDTNDKSTLKEPLNFTDDGFVMRVEGIAYHGSDDPEAGFFYSYDRGETWNGPFYFGDIHTAERFKERILTPRTDYIVLEECLVFISSRIEDAGMSDDVSVIKTNDGGLTWKILAPWVVPCTDPYRAVMSNSVQVDNDEFVTAIRRRAINDRDNCWIDCYCSNDGGKTWEFLSKVGDAGAHNGNPPAMTRLDDGRLCAIYGNRTTRQIVGKYSSDIGKTWSNEFVLRGDFYTGEAGDNMQDLGYPRIVQNADGELVAIYYWALRKNPQQYIAASIWTP